MSFRYCSKPSQRGLQASPAGRCTAALLPAAVRLARMSRFVRMSHVTRAPLRHACSPCDESSVAVCGSVCVEREREAACTCPLRQSCYQYTRVFIQLSNLSTYRSSDCTAGGCGRGGQPSPAAPPALLCELIAAAQRGFLAAALRSIEVSQAVHFLQEMSAEAF